jgi:hypothetical protein
MRKQQVTLNVRGFRSVPAYFSEENYTGYNGSLRRILTCVASNTASQHRRSAQTLLTLAPPSPQVAQSRSCSPSQRPITICLLSVSELSTLRDYVRGTKSASWELK